MKLKALYDLIEGLKLGLRFNQDFHLALSMQHEYPNETLGYIFHNVVRKNAQIS